MRDNYIILMTLQLLSLWRLQNTQLEVLVDNGSLVDILYYPTFQQMMINKELLCLVNVTLIGFGGMKVLPVGTISLQ